MQFSKKGPSKVDCKSAFSEPTRWELQTDKENKEAAQEYETCYMIVYAIVVTCYNMRLVSGI